MTAEEIIKKHFDKENIFNSTKKCMHEFSQQQAISFAEWINENGYHSPSKGIWGNIFIKDGQDTNDRAWTTKELYELFTNKK